MKVSITLVAHDIRSTHNVGAFFRTCDALGIEKIILSGYTPYPRLDDDTRLPHFSDKITRQIHKTALGAETSVDFQHFESVNDVLSQAKSENAIIVSLEQDPRSLSPQECRKVINKKYKDRPIFLFIGNEIHGVADDILNSSEIIMEIPMHGQKESLNVSVATGIALYNLAS